MRHQPLLLADQPPQCIVDRCRIDRGQPQPLQFRNQRQQPPDKLPERRGPRQIRPIGGDIDPGQHDLLIARLHQGAHLCHHGADRNTAAGATAERDDAERAAVVATLLHLDEGARPSGEFGDQMRRRLARRHDVGDRVRRVRRPAFRPQLVLVAKHAVHARQVAPGLRVDLRRAAGDDDPRSRPLAHRTSDRLPRLPFRLGRHGAGVDDHRIGQTGRMVADDLALVGVQPAAEGEDFNGHAG